MGYCCDYLAGKPDRISGASHWQAALRNRNPASDYDFLQTGQLRSQILQVRPYSVHNSGAGLFREKDKDG